MRLVWLAVATGCGRLAFDPQSDATLTGDGRGTDGSAPLGPFGAFTMATEQVGINTPVREFGTTISDDGLELYWSSFRTPTVGKTDIWRSTRVDRISPFAIAAQMVSLETIDDDDEPALSHDGLTLYFQHFTTRPLLVSTRPDQASTAWTAPVPLESPPANLAGFEGADFGPADLRLVVWETATNQLYETTRPTIDSPWGVPQVLPGLGGMTSDGYPAIRSDGLEIFWESTRQPPQAIYHAFRPAIDQPFGAPERLSLGTKVDGAPVGDPDISADGRTLCFVSISAGTGEFDVYLAEREPL